MPRFFVNFEGGDVAIVTGQDAAHIRRALRMRVGDKVTLCDGRGSDYYGEIAEFVGDDVVVKVLYRRPTSCEPTTAVTLYQGLPKGDKLELIIQKSVELGVTAIVPVEMARSVARIDTADKAEKKRQRWQKIADEAAGQSGRGILPAVELPITFQQALQRMQGEDDPVITFYEGGGQPLANIVRPGMSHLSIVIGPEGGFDSSEIEALTEQKTHIATLGPRILRCETAPLAALSVVMALTGNME